MESDLPPIPPILAEPLVEPPREPRPWGLWATLGWAILITVGYIIAQSFAAAAFILYEGNVADLRGAGFQKWLTNGKLVAVATLASAPAIVGLCIVAAWFRKGITIREYFALRWPRPRTILKWFAMFIPYLVAVNLALSLIKGEATEKFMTEMTQSATGAAAPLLWAALFIAAPVSEEFFFRGFLYAGIQHSRLGKIGAVIIPTLLFASIHLQYDLQGLLFVMMAGLFFGIARARTDSLLLPILLHAVMNFVATVGHHYLGD